MFLHAKLLSIIENIMIRKNTKKIRKTYVFVESGTPLHADSAYS